jgi:hypothetical protein
METRHTISDEWLDTAACEALSANSPAESAAYQQQLATLDADQRALDRSLRETVARLATASPYMEPSADLRGRILQATAPKTFRMEDYRRVNSEGSKFFKWGFYAAILFLMAASWYNMWMSNKFTQANNAIAFYKQQAQERNDAIAAFVNPNGTQLTWQDAQGNAFARAIIDPVAHKALVIVPDELAPKNQGLQLSVRLNKDDPKMVTFQTVTLHAPAAELGLKVPANTDLAKIFNVTSLQEDTRKASIAGHQ